MLIAPRCFHLVRVSYADGTTEQNAKRSWIELIARPRFLPLHGDDEDFLQAPVEDGGGGMSKWSETVKNIVAKKREREFELKAAEAAVVDGKPMVEQGSCSAGRQQLCWFAECALALALAVAEGVVDVRIVVGEIENNKMEEQQAINFRRGKARYTKLMPDLREALRLGRRDFDCVYIWYLLGRKGALTLRVFRVPTTPSTSGACGAGPYLTDLRIVKTSMLCDPMQPYVEALRKAGFSVVFRPNKITGGTQRAGARTKQAALVCSRACTHVNVRVCYQICFHSPAQPHIVPTLPSSDRSATATLIRASAACTCRRARLARRVSPAT